MQRKNLIKHFIKDNETYLKTKWENGMEHDTDSSEPVIMK